MKSCFAFLLLFSSLPAAGQAEQALKEEDAVQLALAASHSLAAQQARLQAAKAEELAVSARKSFQAALVYSGQYRSSVPAFTLPFSPDPQHPVVLNPDIRAVGSLALAVSKPLDLMGQLHAALQAAEEKKHLAQAQEKLAKLEVMYAARTAFWQLVAAQAKLQAAQEQLRRAQRALLDAQELEAVGLATRADVLSAEALQASAALAVAKAEHGLHVARSSLCSLLALPTQEDLVLQTDTPLPALPASLETLTQKALASRPELEAWQREAQAFRWQKKQALASRGPQLAMGAQLEWAKPNPRYFPLTDRLRESWAVGLSGTWQLGDGGQAQAAAKTAEALAQAAEASQKEQQRRIALEVEQAYQRLADALALLKAVEANRHAALARQEAISDRFQAGLVSFSELLEAQTALATAELEAVDAKAEVFLAWSQLRRALGE